MAETANVDILINAFTDAAEDALDEVGDSMTSLAGEAQPAQEALDEVANELDDASSKGNSAAEALDDIDAGSLAAAMSVLANRADEAGDEIAQAGRQAQTTSSQFGVMSAASGVLSGASTALSTAMMASLIPSLLTLSTLLLPLAGILGGVAAAGLSLVAVLGGLGAVGAVTHMEELRTAFAEARKEIMEIIAPLGDVFGPLLVDAVEALPALVQGIVDSLGPLDQFANGMRDLGQTMMEVIPAATGVMFDLAERALPVVIEMFDWLMANGTGIMDAVGEAFARLGPVLGDLGAAFSGILPDLFDMGIMVGEIVLPALTDVIGVVADLLDWFGSLDDGLQRVILIGTIAAPVILGIASALTTVIPALISVGSAVTTAVGALSSLLGPAGAAIAILAGLGGAGVAASADLDEAMSVIMDGLDELMSYYQDLWSAVQPVLTGIQDALGAVLGAYQDVIAGFTGSSAFQSLTENVGGLRDQVVSLVSDLASQVRPVFDTITRTLQENSAQFQRLGRMAAQALNFLVGILRNIVLPAVRFIFQNFLIPLLNRLVRVWSENFSVILREVIQTMVAIRDFIVPILNFLAGVWDRWGDEIMTVVNFLFDIVLGIIETALDALYTIIIVGLNLIQGDWDDAWEAIVGFGEDALDGFIDFVENWNIVETINGVLTAIGGAFIALFTDVLPDVVMDGMAWIIGHITAALNTVHNVMADIWNAIASVLADGVEGLINSTIDALNSFLSTLDDVANAVDEVPGVDAPDVGTLDNVTLDSEAIEADDRSTDASELTSQARSDIETAVSLTIEGTGTLADLLREQSSVEAESQSRQQTRRTRRQDPTN